MIRVNRRTTVPPSIENGSKIKTKYLSELQNWRANGAHGSAPEAKYGQDDVKIALIEDFNSKCGFCELKLPRYALQIEHYLPKSKYPDLALDWENFLLSCGDCNRGKGIYDDAQIPLINPCTENPSEFFRYREVVDEASGKNFVFIVAKKRKNENDVERALETIKTIKLNREYVLGKRTEEINFARNDKKTDDGTNSSNYYRKYVLNKNNQEFLGALKFFDLLPP